MASRTVASPRIIVASTGGERVVHVPRSLPVAETPIPRGAELPPTRTVKSRQDAVPPPEPVTGRRVRLKRDRHSGALASSRATEV